MLPVFRIRDGFENLLNNDESFLIAVNVLENKRSVGIFPEASHTNMRKLLPLKKGVPRLAFMAESKNDFNLGVKIVPVGIHYTNYERMGCTVHVMFGKPIDVREYKEAYIQNQQKAMLLLRDEIAKRLSELVINIDSPLHYYAIYKASELFSAPIVQANGIKRVCPVLKYKSQLAISRLLDKNNIYRTEGDEALLSKVESLFRRLGRAKIHRLTTGIRARFFGTLGKLFCLTLFFPFYLYGAINAMPKIYFLKMVLRKFEDRQFHSSLKFVWGIIVSPVFFLAQASLFFAVFGNLEWSLVYLASLPVLVYFSNYYTRTYESWVPEMKLELLRLFKPDKYAKIEAIFQDIVDDLTKSLNPTSLQKSS